MKARLASAAEDVIARCRMLAEFSEEPGYTTRTFLSQPMHAVHTAVRGWMERAGMSVWVDPAGNLRGCYAAAGGNAKCLLIGSHLDTVPRAGAFDGILGVVLGVALIELLEGARLSFGIEVIGFSEEEGVRFGTPFIGSLALIGGLDDELLARKDSAGIRVSDAIAAFGLDSSRIHEAQLGSDALGYLEFHIEQGPVLEHLGLPIAVVEGISGQSRSTVTFQGVANHAGTTPMDLRRDALACAAEWIVAVERESRAVPGAVATAGKMEVLPNASNAVPGRVSVTLDVRHPDDIARHELHARLLDCAAQIAGRRVLAFSSEQILDQPAVAMDGWPVEMLASAVRASGRPIHRMASGAGHDAMILARRVPAAMLFVRSPGGISHQPEENVVTEDVTAALDVGMRFLRDLEKLYV